MGTKTYRWDKETGKMYLYKETGGPGIPRDDLRFDGNFISPIDGKEIRNKTELHDHNQRHNVIQTTEGHNQDWDREEKKRERFFNGNPDGKNERIEAIKRVLDNPETIRRRNRA